MLFVRNNIFVSTNKCLLQYSLSLHYCNSMKVVNDMSKGDGEPVNHLQVGSIFRQTAKQKSSKVALLTHKFILITETNHIAYTSFNCEIFFQIVRFSSKLCTTFSKKKVVVNYYGLIIFSLCW